MAETSPAVLDCNTAFGFWPRARFDLSLDRLLSELNGNGNARALSVCLAGAFLNPIRGNEETLQAARGHPEILPVATVRLGDFAWLSPYRTIGEEVELAKEQGFVAVRVTNEVKPIPFTYEPLREPVDALRGSGLPLLIAAQAKGDVTQIGDLVRGTGVSTIVFGVNASAAGGDPVEALLVARKTPEILLDTARFDYCDMLDRFVEELGPERILFGSGAPMKYFMSAYQVVATSQLSPAEKRKVFAGNLAALIGEAE